jgi:hypothetical protein
MVPQRICAWQSQSVADIRLAHNVGGFVMPEPKLHPERLDDAADPMDFAQVVRRPAVGQQDAGAHDVARILRQPPQHPVFHPGQGNTLTLQPHGAEYEVDLEVADAKDLPRHSSSQRLPERLAQARRELSDQERLG